MSDDYLEQQLKDILGVKPKERLSFDGAIYNYDQFLINRQFFIIDAEYIAGNNKRKIYREVNFMKIDAIKKEVSTILHKHYFPNLRYYQLERKYQKAFDVAKEKHGLTFEPNEKFFSDIQIDFQQQVYQDILEKEGLFKDHIILHKGGGTTERDLFKLCRQKPKFFDLETLGCPSFQKLIQMYDCVELYKKLCLLNCGKHIMFNYDVHCPLAENVIFSKWFISAFYNVDTDIKYVVEL